MSRILLLALILFSLLQPGICAAEDDHHHHEVHDSAHNGHTEEAHDKHKNENELPTFIEISPQMAKESGVIISKVKRDTIVEEVSLPGEISVNGNTLVHIAPRFPGTLKIVAKQIGEKVRVGDLLAKIQSNESLSLYEIKSEIDGTIIDKDSAAGEFVTNEKIIFTIANFDTVWVNAAVYTNQIGLVKKGQQVIVESKSNNLTQVGTIDYIRPTLSESTRTALARVVLQNNEKKWFPGMFVNVKTKVPSTKAALLIPSESAVFLDNAYVAFIPGESPDGHNGFEIRPIKVGKDNGQTVEVIEGLEKGLSIASGNTYILKAELGKGSAEHSH